MWRGCGEDVERVWRGWPFVPDFQAVGYVKSPYLVDNVSGICLFFSLLHRLFGLIFG
jgi:hypothetical protein